MRVGDKLRYGGDGYQLHRLLDVHVGAVDLLLPAKVEFIY